MRWNHPVGIKPVRYKVNTCIWTIVNFILAVDECYSDIFRMNRPKPPGALEAAASLGEGLDNLVIFNSLSKRSNISGMRAGFIAGDEKIIESYKLLVSNGASPVPIPVQKVAAAFKILLSITRSCCSSSPTQSGSRTSRSANASVTGKVPWVCDTICP